MGGLARTGPPIELSDAVSSEQHSLDRTVLFKTAPEGASVETVQQDGVARVSVRMAGASGDQTLALAVLKKFVGAFKESDVNLVGGMLERNAGRLSLTMQVGGEQRLTVEVPLGTQDGASTEAERC